VVWAGLVADPAHDQPGGGRVLIGVRGGGERGERHLGDLGVGDQVAGVGVDDSARVVHRCPGLLGDAADRAVHRAVLGQHH
jgi:hypothetical protein